MPTFQIDHPDGTSWEIDAPDQQSAMAALASFRPQQFGSLAPPTTGQDVAKAAAAGAERGLIAGAGTPGDVASYLNRGIDWAERKLGLNPGPTDYDLGTSGQIQRAVENQTGPLYTPQSTAGQYANTAAEFAANPFSYLGGEAGLARKAIGAATAGVGSEALGQATQGSWAEPYARNLGAIAGGYAPYAAQRAITPMPTGLQRTRDVAALRAEGVPLTAGDVTGNATLRATESELSHGMDTKQRDAFQQAAFNRVGVQVGDRPITGQGGVIDTLMHDTGAQFDALSGRNTLQADQQLLTDLRNTHNTYTSVPGLYPRETVNSVVGAQNRIMQALNNGNGVLSGEDYQTLRSNLRAGAQGATDPQRAAGLHDVVNSLDDAMERSIGRNNPADAGAFGQARRDYRNALVLQQWAGAANMTPATLSQAAKSVYGRNQYVRGVDDFSDLADPGRRMLAQFQDSGTPRRQIVEKAVNAGSKAVGLLAGGGGGAGIAAASGHDPVVGLLLGEAMGPFVGRPLARGALMNPATQGYLGNQLMPHPPADPFSARLARALAQTLPQNAQ